MHKIEKISVKKYNSNDDWWMVMTFGRPKFGQKVFSTT
jgi:hypothetical protein